MSDRNQDKEKREKQGDPEHDESVLNPERKDELDLSKKERRLIEKEKLKGMGIGKKLEYIWMYYKPVIFGVIAAIALVFGVRDYYEGLKVKTVLSVAVVDSRIEDTDSTAEEIKEQLGYEGDKYSRVEINVNMTSNEDGDGLEYYAQMIGETGTAGSVYNTMSETLNNTVNTVDNKRQQVIGVSSDEELTSMIQFQNAYNAASRFMNVVSDMIETLINGL